jgi:hypothetical protein
LTTDYGKKMVEIRAFDGNFEEVSSLIKASWLQEYREKYNQPVIDYSSIDFLEWNLKRPNSDPDLLFGAYLNGKLIAFAAGIPHTLRYNDQKFRAASTSFFTTHVDHKGKGIGKELIRIGLLKGIEKGYEMNTFVPDEGHVVENFIKKLSREMNLKFMKLHRFTFLTKPLDQRKLSELVDFPLYQKIALPIITKKETKIDNQKYIYNPEEDLKFIEPMVNRSLPPNTLSVFWTEDILSSNLRSKISDTFFINEGEKKAFINYYNIDMLGSGISTKSHKITMVDYVHLENLSFYQKHQFVSNFCSDQKERGSCAITVPTIPVFDPKPFLSNLFIPNGRYHWFCAHDFNHKLNDPVNVGYLFFR